jgi:hypothetical protein
MSNVSAANRQAGSGRTGDEVSASSSITTTEFLNQNVPSRVSQTRPSTIRVTQAQGRDARIVGSLKAMDSIRRHLSINVDPHDPVTWTS